MPIRQPLLAIIAALVALAPAAVAQDDASTPEQVARAFLGAARDTNWFRMASLMHPDALAQFHGLFAPFLQCQTSDAAQARQQVFGIGSTVEAARMSDTALVAALFRTAIGREAGVAAMMRTARMRVIGHVAEGSDTVHVVTRMSMAIDTVPLSQLELVSLARYGSSWRVLLKADFSALGIMLRRVCSSGG